MTIGKDKAKLWSSEMPPPAARAAGASDDRERSRTPLPRRNVTSPGFKSLFPKSESVLGMSCKHDQTKSFCQVVYPCYSEKFIQPFFPRMGPF